MANESTQAPVNPNQQPVVFPLHLYPPVTAQTVDAANIVDVSPATTFRLISITVPQGSIFRVLQYALFNDGLLAADFDFVIRVQSGQNPNSGFRLYPFHGNSVDGYRQYLGRSNDLGNNGLIYAYTTVQPGDTYTVDAINRSAVVTTMGARVVGYMDKSQLRSQDRFGG